VPFSPLLQSEGAPPWKFPVSTPGSTLRSIFDLLFYYNTLVVFFQYTLTIGRALFIPFRGNPSSPTTPSNYFDRIFRIEFSRGESADAPAQSRFLPPPSFFAPWAEHTAPFSRSAGLGNCWTGPESPSLLTGFIRAGPPIPNPPVDCCPPALRCCLPSPRVYGKESDRRRFPTSCIREPRACQFPRFFLPTC